MSSTGHCSACHEHIGAQRSVARKLSVFFAERDGQQAHALYAHLAEVRDPKSILAWLRTAHPEVLAYLGRIGRGTSADRDVLEQLTTLRGGTMLLSSCERAGIVGPRPARIAHLEAQLAQLVTGLSKSSALLLSAYWRFCLRRAIESRPARQKVRDPSLHTDRTYLKIARDFLAFLDTRGRSIAETTQADLDSWLSTHAQWKGAYLRRFLASPQVEQHLGVRLSIAKRQPSPAAGVSDDTYFGVLDRARRDRRLPLLVRVALVLVAVCGKTVSEIVRLRTNDVIVRDGGEVDIRFPKGTPQPLQGRDAQLVLRLVTQGRRWLFEAPTGQPFAAISLRGKIARAGVDVDLTMLWNAARRQMLRDLEPGDLVKILGFQNTVAGAWAKRIAPNA